MNEIVEKLVSLGVEINHIECFARMTDECSAAYAQFVYKGVPMSGVFNKSNNLVHTKKALERAYFSEEASE